jgi:hypothetical protein
MLSRNEKSGGGELSPEVVPGEGAGDAAGPLLHIAAGLVVHVRIGDHVGDGEAAAGPQDARRLAEDGRLVGGEIDDAVADDHIDRVPG